MLVLARKALTSKADATRAETYRNFFKNSKDDVFLGVSVPLIRKIAKDFWQISLADVFKLMKSDIHDERSLANAILRIKFTKGNDQEKIKIFNFYIKNRNKIRTWDSVDDSAPYIVGAHLLGKDVKILYGLASSKHIWSRRIAIVSTWWFIRNDKLDDTFKIAKILLQDKEDLIHKATGWMLREAGKRKPVALKKFLNTHHAMMPRTMLRYAIEKFDMQERKKYMKK